MGKLLIHLSLASAFTAAFLTPSIALAYECDFNMSGDVSGSFTLNCAPTPNSYGGGGGVGAFGLDNISGVLNGTPTTFSAISFANEGPDYPTLYLFVTGSATSLFGPQLFTGDFWAPTGFVPGTYALGPTIGSTADTLTISVAAPVPEPATWAMMLLGFGAIGFAMRRDQQPGLAHLA